ncbi:hypothetical protein BDQ17DRAFT_1382799 [Cyathus striatus]|nr:hypothetical protein BDQ17DRAFT_1382799 [Cyathus striatus]
MIEQSFVPRLMQIFHRAPESPIRVSFLWAVKSLVRKLDVEKSREVMGCVGWGVVSSYVFPHIILKHVFMGKDPVMLHMVLWAFCVSHAWERYCELVLLCVINSVRVGYFPLHTYFIRDLLL